MTFLIDDRFEWFLEQFGTPDLSIAATDSILNKYKGILPDRLLEYWQEYGFCRFEKGLFWIVNPEDYQEAMNTWIKATEVDSYDKFHVIARTAFGSMILWGKNTGQSWTIDILNAQLFFEGADKKRISEGKENDALKGFFAIYSPDSAHLEDVDTDESIFEQAVIKFGPLSHDEMFTFEPALFLGGEQTLKTVNKVNFFIQSEILASMDQREIMDIKRLAKKAFGKQP